MVSQNPEKTPSTPKKNLTFALFLPTFALFQLEIRHDWSMEQLEQPAQTKAPFDLVECWRSPAQEQEQMNAPLLYGEHTKEGHPPPAGERKECLAPIIFRAKNIEKSSPQRTG